MVIANKYDVEYQDDSSLLAILLIHKRLAPLSALQATVRQIPEHAEALYLGSRLHASQRIGRLDDEITNFLS